MMELCRAIPPPPSHMSSSRFVPASAVPAVCRSCDRPSFFFPVLDIFFRPCSTYFSGCGVSMFEAVGYKLYDLAGIASPATAWAQVTSMAPPINGSRMTSLCVVLHPTLLVGLVVGFHPTIPRSIVGHPATAQWPAMPCLGRVFCHALRAAACRATRVGGWCRPIQRRLLWIVQ